MAQRLTQPSRRVVGRRRARHLNTTRSTGGGQSTAARLDASMTEGGGVPRLLNKIQLNAPAIHSHVWDGCADARCRRRTPFSEHVAPMFSGWRGVHRASSAIAVSSAVLGEEEDGLSLFHL